MPARRAKEETALSERRLVEARAAARRRQAQHKVLYESVVGPQSLFGAAGFFCGAADNAGLGMGGGPRDMDFVGVQGLEGMWSFGCDLGRIVSVHGLKGICSSGFEVHGLIGMWSNGCVLGSKGSDL